MAWGQKRRGRAGSKVLPPVQLRGSVLRYIRRSVQTRKRGKEEETGCFFAAIAEGREGKGCRNETEGVGDLGCTTTDLKGKKGTIIPSHERGCLLCTAAIPKHTHPLSSAMLYPPGQCTVIRRCKSLIYGSRLVSTYISEKKIKGLNMANTKIVSPFSMEQPP